MQPRILPPIAFLVALLLAVTLSGCGLFGGEAEDNTDPIPQEPLPPPDPPPPPAPSDPEDVLLDQIAADPGGACPDWAPNYQNVGYTGLTNDEAKVYSEVLVCSHTADVALPSGQAGIFLTNMSDGVWSFTGHPSEYQLLKTTTAAEFFRTTGVVPRDLAVMAPGDSVSITDWTRITWVPDPALTAAWAAQEFMTDYVWDRGAKYAGDTLARKTGHSAAILKCVLSAYRAAKSESELEPTSALVDRIQNELKASAAASCSMLMGEADTLADEQGHARKTKVTWNQHVNQLSGQVDNGLQVGKYLNFAAAVCRIVPKC